MTATRDLDEFQLVRPLGRGGMGEVYLGHDTVLDRAVAIKLIRSRSPDAASRERFLIEARAIARLSHPNVVTIFRVGTTRDGRPFLVQELIRGRSLDQAARPMPWREVCELGIGIARGLEAAHRRGILHRDIKPANVMLDEHGTARLLDFGVAKLGVVGGPGLDAEPAREGPPAPETLDPALGDDRAPGSTKRERPAGVDRRAAGVAETLDAPPPPEPAAAAGSPLPSVIHTPPGSVIGTPLYTAPENWRGEPSTAQSDLYSLGALLYELLAGAPPYPETELGELRRAVLAGPSRAIGELAPEAPAALAGLVMRCLAPEQAARPGSAAEVVHELEAMIVDAPAVPDGNPYRGLRAFDAAHRGLFFGRGADVSAIVDRLRTEPILVVVGDSGIGKSSVCHAGVVPAVIAGGLGDRRAWRAVSIAPGRAPWTALCDALALGAGDDLARALRPADGSGLLVVIDQLEELVTLSDPAEAARTAELLAAIADGVPGVKALLAARGDFLTRIAALPGLGGPMARGLHLLRVLSPADLREAIVGPARTQGVRFETATMVDELVAAVAANPGALPLLQFTLAELWQARDAERGVIPAAALASLGGVDGGLAGHADRALLELGAAERAAARRIVLRLVTEARTRAVRPRDELLGDDPIAAAALESLVRGRLVVARDTVAGTPSYELAHEALIRSWATLRDWLDAATGEHAARSRLIASAAEWQRLDRRPDLLWTRRQLDEVRALDGLNPGEQAFVAASRAQLRRRRIAWIGAIAAVPLLAAAIYAGVRIDAARTRAREVAARVAAAAQHEVAGARHAADAAQLRARAFDRFDADADAEGEPLWLEARALAARADEAYRQAERELEGAFLVEAGSVREPMARLLWEHAELAEAQHDGGRVAELLLRLSTYDAALRASWDAPANLVLDLDTRASVAIHPPRSAGTRKTVAGGFDGTPVVVRTGTHVDAQLAAGSYLVIATTDDGRFVYSPVLLARGERLVERLAIPRTIPEGYVYVPASRFLFGSGRDEAVRRDFLRTQPIHAIRGSAFWIARTEVTYAGWIEYLRTLPPKERALRRPQVEGNMRGVRLVEVGERYRLEFSPSDDWYHANEGEPLVYPDRTTRRSVRWDRMAVTGVSAEDVQTYTAWLDRTGGLPGARLCTVREWEHAARGADGRSYPHGEVLAPSDANFDATYSRTGFGLDEVGSFPASDSPFGISDLAGNASEMVRGARGALWTKGGSFFYSSVTALSSNSSPIVATLRDLKLGIRICATAEPAR